MKKRERERYKVLEERETHTQRQIVKQTCREKERMKERNRE